MQPDVLTGLDDPVVPPVEVSRFIGSIAAWMVQIHPLR